MRSFYPKGAPILLLALTLLSSACSHESRGSQDGFESDLPSSSNGGGARGESTAGGDATGIAPGAPAAEDDSASSESPERAILEADIVQLSGDTLYAMSRNGGLSLIDVSNPQSLKLLGRYRELSGEPFEMYVQDGVVFAMFSSWGEYVAVGDSYSYVQTSKLVALDVKDPAAIKVLGKFDVPGRVSDSRIVGKVLYVVGHEDGYCWGCQQDKPRTTVVSLNVSDPRAPSKVDELSFSDAQNYGWSRSVTVTDKRMYVAGPEYGQNGPTGSSIQVVDISDPAGDLVEGAVVKVAGQVSSRWQIDEYQGVLRVISQPDSWSVQGRRAPSVQTFRVQSASELSALGSTQLVLPDSRETLRSVRFDGTRAYAITALQQDPLFTIDLSDPARPRQVGELHMPGFVYHMEPRGDRVIGLGFDQGNPEGAIAVSIFDVANLAAPKLLSRANFGGDWASLPEDQDRIHKAFRILPELGLVLVPFSGWTDWRRDEQKRCASHYQSGVQLLDLSGDTLKLRGTAPSVGEARRALVHREHLFTISDARVETFDIRDRNAPRQDGGVALSRYVQQTIPLANGVVARVNSSYWSDSPWIDLVGSAEVDAPERSLGELALGEALRGDGECEPYSYVEAAFGQGSQVELLYRRYEYTADYREQQVIAGVLVIDAADPSTPKLSGKLEWNMRRDGSDPNWSDYEWYSGYGDYTVSYNPSAVSFARVGDALIALESSTRWDTDRQRTKVRLRAVDLSDPSAPSTHVVALQDRHYTGLSASGDEVLLGYYGEGSKAGRVRFFVQRVDLADPSQLAIDSAISVPGLLMYHDAGSQRLITSQLTRVNGGTVTAEECDQRFGFYEIKYPDGAWISNVGSPTGSCAGYQQTLHLVKLDGDSATLEDSLVIEEQHVISSSSLGADRLFAVLNARYSYWGIGIEDCFGPCGGRVQKADPVELLVLSGFERGRFSTGRVSVESSSDPWWGFWGSPPVYAHGTSAILTGSGDLSLVDAADSAAPTLMRTEPLFGWVNHVSFQDDTAFLALGQGGAQRLELR